MKTGPQSTQLKITCPLIKKNIWANKDLKRLIKPQNTHQNLKHSGFPFDLSTH